MDFPSASALDPASAGGDWFRLLFERSADALALLDPVSGTFVASNHASAVAAGAGSPGDLCGLPPSALAPEFQADGRPSADVAREAVRRTLEQGSHRFEWTMKRLDGILTHVDVTATALSDGDRTLILTATRNIERTKRIEGDLHVSESRWQRLFDQAPMSVQVFAPDGTSRQGNAAFRKLFGPVLPDLHEFNIRTDPQLEAAGMNLLIERAFAGEVVVIPPIPFEMRIGTERESRGVRWIGSTMFPVFDSEGKLVEVVCVHEDQTDRKRAGEEINELNQSLERRIAERTAELRESEERFKALFELSPLGMARVSWDGQFRQVNPSFARMLGYDPEEVLDLSYWDVTPIEYQAQEEQILEIVRETGRFGPFEKEYIHRDGHRIPIVLSGMMIQGADGQNELWGIAQDVTVRKQAEQALRESEKKFRTLFEESSQGVMLHDENTCFSEVNPAAAALFGIDAADFAGRHPAEFAAEFQPNGERSETVARREIQRCLESGTSRFEWTHRHAAGHSVSLEVVLSRIPNGDRYLMQAVVTDISERKRAEQELTRALERERELNQLKSNFVSMVSHEFRTPLGIIQSSAEILNDYLDQLDPEERREQLQSIIKNSRRMAGLMEDVLLLGRLDSGRMEFTPRPLDLAGLCRRLVDEVRSTTDARCPIEFSTSGLPAEACADERLLRHILLNLLSNAVKYSPAGQPVSFRAGCTDGALVFWVRDRGIGIPEEDLPVLFEAFRRGSNVGQTPGTGLGLVIVKQSVELHGGHLQVDNRPGGGTRFTITIPLSPA
ncbi:PAS domain S-box protein [Luteolibacter marinus]|uniref:sensor histidine kinase n=1 Tax=Luteolibacter marinus TaxID=2776705 RepID=UPI0018696D9D|nr:PAS domain S-box protein [Luteolibacter marinus]